MCYQTVYPLTFNMEDELYVEILTKPSFLASLCQAVHALPLHPSIPLWSAHHKQSWKTLALYKWHTASILVTTEVYCCLLSWSHTVLPQQAMTPGTATSTRSAATLFHHVMQTITLARHISSRARRACWVHLLHRQSKAPFWHTNPFINITDFMEVLDMR